MHRFAKLGVLFSLVVVLGACSVLQSAAYSETDRNGLIQAQPLPTVISASIISKGNSYEITSRLDQIGVAGHDVENAPKEIRWQDVDVGDLDVFTVVVKSDSVPTSIDLAFIEGSVNEEGLPDVDSRISKIPVCDQGGYKKCSAITKSGSVSFDLGTLFSVDSDKERRISIISDWTGTNAAGVLDKIGVTWFIRPVLTQGE